MEILVCVKRVPTVGGTMALTDDGKRVDTRMSGFTVSPHEECAVEEAVRIIERLGGSVTVLTLGPPEAADQVRDMLALGAHHGVVLETDGQEWGPIATAAAIEQSIARRTQVNRGYDLLLFGNEAADTGGYQVPVRVAHGLGMPCVTGIKHLEVSADEESVRARREYQGVEEVFELPLPAVVSVKEGINLPRYPSLPGRLRARRGALQRDSPARLRDGLHTVRLRLPEGERQHAHVLGTGTKAVPALVDLLDELGVLS